jgi:hypothetical protein
MTEAKISPQRRREIIDEANAFAEAYRIGRSYAAAGDMEMAHRFYSTVKRCAKSPEEKAWLLEQRKESIARIVAEDRERCMMGLPPLENKKPSFH